MKFLMQTGHTHKGKKGQIFMLHRGFSKNALLSYVKIDEPAV